MNGMTIAIKLGLVLALFALLASGITGYYAYDNSRAQLLAAAERDQLTATQVLGRRLQITLDKVARDVRLMAAATSIHQALVEPDALLRQQAVARTVEIFGASLNENPEFFQMRLIDAGDFGLERVRVDRDGLGRAWVQGDELQEKGHLPYVYETLELGARQLFLSPIGINREDGAHAGFGKPSLIMATPVVVEGRKVGVVVVNLDLQGLFSLMGKDLPSGYHLYLTNTKGDYVIHPDPQQTFGFERGRSFTLQQDLPAAAALFTGERDQLVDNSEARGVLTTYIAVDLSQPQPARRWMLGLSQPRTAILASSQQLGQTLIRFVLGFSAAALLMALLLARAMTRPLKQMVVAAGQFAEQRQMGELPQDRHDELGELGRSFAAMQQQIGAHLEELERQRRQLQHQVLHDPLTGLANRRLFFEYIEPALARARRNQRGLALLFIDLDGFKQINDNHGHSAGDQVLMQVALQLQAAVRESDLVARLAGDEFVILIEGVDSADSAQRVVAQIRQRLAEPMALGNGRSVRLAASVGISLYPDHGHNANELVHRADQAMYQAKKGGGDSNCVATSVSPTA